VDSTTAFYFSSNNPFGICFIKISSYMCFNTVTILGFYVTISCMIRILKLNLCIKKTKQVKFEKDIVQGKLNSFSYFESMSLNLPIM